MSGDVCLGCGKAIEAGEVSYSHVFAGGLWHETCRLPEMVPVPPPFTMTDILATGMLTAVLMQSPETNDIKVIGYRDPTPEHQATNEITFAMSHLPGYRVRLVITAEPDPDLEPF
jgi:hypothetical protein